MVQLRSKAQTEKKRSKRKKVYLHIIAAFIVCTGLFVWYAWDNRFHITTLEITGASFAREEDIASLINKKLSEKALGFIPKKSPLLFSKNGLVDMLHVNFPPLKHITVEIDNGFMNVMLQERIAAFIFCGGGSVCYFMDETGFVFIPAPEFKGSSYVKISSYQYPDDIVVGTYAVAPELLSGITSMIDMFELQGIRIKKADVMREGEVTMTDENETAYFILTTTHEVVIQERLRAILGAHPGVTSGDYDYVDMRIEGKVFLKKKEI